MVRVKIKIMALVELEPLVIANMLKYFFFICAGILTVSQCMEILGNAVQKKKTEKFIKMTMGHEITNLNPETDECS